MNDHALFSVHRLVKSFPQGRGVLKILHGIDLQVHAGEALCIVGSSGAGKSTLMHILGTLDRPTSGRVLFRGKDLFRLSDDDLADFRNRSIGFVFQFHHLLAEFTALENVMMPCLIAGEGRRKARILAEELLKILGLRDRQGHYPSELSGGEQQRVAIARALVRKPQVLFADEPTGNLDSQNSQQIQQLFFELKNRLGLTLIVVSHDRQFASRFPRVLTMKDGSWA